MKKSWHLSRRTFLRGAGVSMALPLLEGMLPGGRPARAAEAALPRRMVCCYVPNGVNIVQWVPQTPGRGYQLSPTHQALAEFRDEFSVLSGLCHPRAESGHPGGDTFLTAAELRGTPGYDYKNSISADQVAAEKLSQLTRFPSLQLSRSGGTGPARGTTTMSFSREGVPLAAENNPRLVFERLFLEDAGSARDAQKLRLAEERSILDAVLESSRSLARRLGGPDQRKLDEYLTAIRAVEQQVGRSEAWLDRPKAQVSAEGLLLDADSRSSRELQEYLRTMFDLTFLALKTDTTRLVTFQLDREVANHTFTNYLGFSDTFHGLSHHGGDPDALAKLAQIDRFYLSQLSYFLGKLKSATEADGNLLDRTMILYGSGMNSGEHGGHYATNLPILLAGGRALGIKQGQHLAYAGLPSVPPLSNLLATMLSRLEIGVERFADSTGQIGELLG